MRYYADIGLVAPAGRGANGHRDYDEGDVRRLAFVRRARAFGISVEDCLELLALYADRGRASAAVKEIATARMAELDRRMAELAALRADLGRLAEACRRRRSRLPHSERPRRPPGALTAIVPFPARLPPEHVKNRRPDMAANTRSSRRARGRA